MPMMDKATIMVTLPKGSPGKAHKIEFEHNTAQTQLAKDIADGLREKGYAVTVHIEKQITEEY